MGTICLSQSWALQNDWTDQDTVLIRDVLDRDFHYLAGYGFYQIPDSDVKTVRHIDKWFEVTIVLRNIAHIPLHMWVYTEPAKEHGMSLCGLRIVLPAHAIHSLIARTMEAVLAASSLKQGSWWLHQPLRPAAVAVTAFRASGLTTV